MRPSRRPLYGLLRACESVAHVVRLKGLRRVEMVLLRRIGDWFVGEPVGAARERAFWGFAGAACAGSAGAGDAAVAAAGAASAGLAGGDDRRSGGARPSGAGGVGICAGA